MILQYRCEATGHRAILKWRGETYGNGYPRDVLCFVTCPEARSAIGRWFETPNANLKAFAGRHVAK